MSNPIKKFFAHNPDREVQNKELFLYSVGVFGQNNTYNMVSSWFFYFCIDVMNIDPLIIGFVLGAARIWDGINDPLVGVIVDRHTFKNGERLRPYLRIMAAPIGILTALMFVDVGMPTKFMGLYICALYFVWDIFYSFQDIAQWGMTAMVSTHSSERGRAAQFGRIGGMFGGWLPGLITIAIANKGLLGATEKQIFLVAGILLGFGGMMVSMLTSCAKERTPVTPPQGNLGDALKLLFSNKIVMALFLATVLSNITLVVQDIYFFKYMIEISAFGRTFNGLNVQFVYGILVGLPGTLAIFIASWFARKVGGMKNLIMFATAMNIITRVTAFFIGYEGYRIIIMGILLAVSGIPNNMTGIATTTLLGDSVDYMEWKTGHRNEGAVFAVQNLMAKISSGLKVFFSGITLKILLFDATKYDADLPQNERFYEYVWPIFILGPALGSILYLIPLAMLRYDEKQKHQIEAELKVRRAATKQSSVEVGKLHIPTAEENLNIPIY